MHICIDALDSKPRFDHPFDYFVRVLVYMNLSVKLRHNVLVEIQGYAFLVDIEYENLPQSCSQSKMTRHFLHSCKNLKTFDFEKDQPKPKATVYVPKKPNPKGLEHKGNDPIIMDNTVLLDSETCGDVKVPEMTLDSQEDINDQYLVDPVNIPLNQNNPNALAIVVEEESKDSSQDKEFVNVTQLMEDENDSIEKLPLDDNQIFLQNSWESFEKNQVEVDGAEDSHDGGHSHYFTLVRAKKKNKKVKQSSGYITR